MNGTKIEIIANNRQWHFVNNFWLSVYLSVASSFSVDSNRYHHLQLPHLFTPDLRPIFPQVLPTIDFFTFITTDFTDSYHTVSSEHIRVFNLFLILPFLIFLFPCGWLSWHVEMVDRKGQCSQCSLATHRDVVGGRLRRLHMTRRCWRSHSARCSSVDRVGAGGRRHHRVWSQWPRWDAVRRRTLHGRMSRRLTQQTLAEVLQTWRIVGLVLRHRRGGNYTVHRMKWRDVPESMVTIRSPFCGHDAI